MNSKTIKPLKTWFESLPRRKKSAQDIPLPSSPITPADDEELLRNWPPSAFVQGLVDLHWDLGYEAELLRERIRPCENRDSVYPGQLGTDGTAALTHMFNPNRGCGPAGDDTDTIYHPGQDPGHELLLPRAYDIPGGASNAINSHKRRGHDHSRVNSWSDYYAEPSTTRNPNVDTSAAPNGREDMHGNPGDGTVIDGVRHPALRNPSIVPSDEVAEELQTPTIPERHAGREYADIVGQPHESLEGPGNSTDHAITSLPVDDAASNYCDSTETTSSFACTDSKRLERQAEKQKATHLSVPEVAGGVSSSSSGQSRPSTARSSDQMTFSDALHKTSGHAQSHNTRPLAGMTPPMDLGQGRAPLPPHATRPQLRKLEISDKDPCGCSRQVHQKSRVSPTEPYKSNWKYYPKITTRYADAPEGLLDALQKAVMEGYWTEGMVSTRLSRESGRPSLNAAFRDMLRLERRVAEPVPSLEEMKQGMRKYDAEVPGSRPRANDCPSWCGDAKDHWHQLDIFNSHFSFLLVSPWPVDHDDGDKYVWLHAKKYLPEMDEPALTHWLDAIRRNQEVVLVRTRRVLNAVMVALQAIRRHEDAVKLVHKFPYQPKSEAGRSATFLKQILKMEEVWLVWVLFEIGEVLDLQMLGTCLDPTCGKHKGATPVNDAFIGFPAG